MALSLLILGSSSALPTSQRNPAAQILKMDERLFLIDCGEGTQMQIRRHKQGFNKIDHIFISHMHADHYLGLFGLIATMGLLGRRRDLHIYAPSEIEEMISCVNRHFTEDPRFKIIFHHIEKNSGETIYEDRRLSIECIPLTHRIPTFGFLFREKPPPLNIRKEAIDRYSLSIRDIQAIKDGQDHTTEKGETIPNTELTLPPKPRHSYAYCSDTAYDERIVPQLKGVSMLYHEATFMEKDAEWAQKTWHSTASQAARIAKLAGAGQLLIGHYSARYKDEQEVQAEARETFPGTQAAVDGKWYEIGGS
jgi:ribonuclease Z